MSKYVKLFEETFPINNIPANSQEFTEEALPGTGAEDFKIAHDTKNAANQVDEDTNEPDGAEERDGEGQELRSNDDLSNHAVPLSFNENDMKSHLANQTVEELQKSKREWIRRKYSTKTHSSEKKMASSIIDDIERELERRSLNKTNEDEQYDLVEYIIHAQGHRHASKQWTREHLNKLSHEKLVQVANNIAHEVDQIDKKNMQKSSERYDEKIVYPEVSNYDLIEYIIHSQGHRHKSKHWTRMDLNQLGREQLEKIVGHIELENGAIERKDQIASADRYNESLEKGRHYRSPMEVPSGYEHLNKLSDGQLKNKHEQLSKTIASSKIAESEKPSLREAFSVVKKLIQHRGLKTESLILGFDAFINESKFEKGKSLRQHKSILLKSIAARPKTRETEQEKEVNVQTAIRKTATE